MKSTLLKLIKIYTDAIEHIKTLPVLDDGVSFKRSIVNRYDIIRSKSTSVKWYDTELGRYLIKNNLEHGICTAAESNNLTFAVGFSHDFTGGHGYYTATPVLCRTEAVLRSMQMRVDRMSEMLDWTPKQI